MFGSFKNDSYWSFLGGIAVVAANDHSLVDENFGSKITGSQDFEFSACTSWTAAAAAE